LREPLEEQARSLGLARNIKFAGFQRNIPDWLAASDFTVLPSLFEGLPLAAMESLAMAKPVIATAVDGTPEVVLHGRTGLLVPPRDASALARAMCRLLGDRDWAGQLGIAGRKWILDHFSIGRQIRETEALYFEAIKKRVRVRATADAVEAKLV
jgi:glycosyltransferase involved in cell wall biosynthesis